MIAFATNLLTTSQRNPSRFLEPAVRAGVVKPRQPLCDLNPFDSIFLILRRVVSAPRLFPRCFPSSAEGKALATYLPTALHDLCRKPIPAPLKCHSVGRGATAPAASMLPLVVR